MAICGGRTAIREPGATESEQDREEAFARLIDAGLDRSFRTARLILRNDADAEDAVQDAVVSAWRHWRELRDRDRFDAWFGRILLNRCRDRLRTAGRTQDIDLTPALPARETDAVARLESRIDIGRAFESLNPDQRIAVVLRYWSDLSIDQIAERVQAPAGTIKSRLHHALERLRTSLEQAEVN
jgi:RNA polymerase sigma-70 factor (ECF subfamily)